jgi:tRNA pseudouridine38/39 synthase
MLVDSQDSSNSYEGWSTQQLIARICELEESATATTTESPSSIPYRKPPKHAPKPFDFSKYNTRLIALKFAYLGQKYNGFEHHRKNYTPLPTVEEEVWKALVTTRLINPIPTEKDGVEKAPRDGLNRTSQKQMEGWEREGADVNWEGCEYSKCGRTDRGVSAFGQVIGVRVRSNRPVPKASKLPAPAAATSDAQSETGMALEEPDSSVEASEGEQGGVEESPFDPINDELPYIQLLNRVLPPDIRILAWCPNPPPNFSARFSCRERRYKYFFTNPCFPPVPGSGGLYTPQSAGGLPRREGWLDIEAMREGCRNLVGLHDFRNFCRIDTSKQITNFQRRIFHADIEEISPLSIPSFLASSSLQPPSSSPGGDEQPKMYAFVVHGSAFLWHQVRTLVAIIFRIGQGLESPDLVEQLLDIEANPTRPKYEMADDAPLVLWDCIFPAESDIQSSDERETGYTDSLDWVYVGQRGGLDKSLKLGVGKGKWGRGGLMDDIWEVWRGKKIEECLSASLMDVVSKQGNGLAVDDTPVRSIGRGVRIFDGANSGRSKGNYLPVLQMERMESVEVMNERYARKKGWDPAKSMVKDTDPDE